MVDKIKSQVRRVQAQLITGAWSSRIELIHHPYKGTVVLIETRSVGEETDLKTAAKTPPR
jgi:hypothetical protein